MNIIKLVYLILVLLLAFQGCIEETLEETPMPTATPNVTVTMEPTETVNVTPAITPETEPEHDARIPVIYVIWMDTGQGFKVIRAVRNNSNIPLPMDFDKLNFSIEKGETVRWVNDDINDLPMTVISNEGLWTNQSANLRWQDSRFEYAFNKSGTYTFSIKEYRRIRNQTITVI